MFFCFTLVVLAATIIILFRREIRFRYHFGVWQGQRGAERLVRKKLHATVAKIVSAAEARSRAAAEFEACVDLPAPMSQKRKALNKALRRERSLYRRYKTLCDLAEAFMLKDEVKIAGEELNRSKFRLVG